MKKLYILFIILISLNSITYSQGFSRRANYSDFSLIPSKVIIYPNPVTDNKFFVKSDVLIKKVELLNVLGQKIKTINNETDIPYNILVETDNLKKGMYMVSVSLETGEKIINKIIVK